MPRNCAFGILFCTIVRNFRISCRLCGRTRPTCGCVCRTGWWNKCAGIWDWPEKFKGGDKGSHVAALVHARIKDFSGLKILILN